MTENATPSPQPVTSTLPPEDMESPRERWAHRGNVRKKRRNLGSKADKFLGHTKELKDHIYDLNYNVSDQYTLTSKVIA